MLVELVAVCVLRPECAVRELRPWADKIVCVRTGERRWRCVAAMRSGHVFRYQVRRVFGPVEGVEYVGGHLVARRVQGAWRIGG